MRIQNKKPIHPLVSVIAVAALVLCCVADPKPDIPQTEVGRIDTERVRVNSGSGQGRVLLTGLEGAAQGRGTRVQVQNLVTGDITETDLSSAGSFTVEIDASPTQILGLTVELGAESGDTVFVAGNAEREAVEIGDDDSCRMLLSEEEECLVCESEGVEEVVGCELLDFFPDEAPLNPFNVAECLFLNTDFVELFPVPELQDSVGDLRFGSIDVFNGCGEVLFVSVAEIITETPERFDVFPSPGEEMGVEPTFFAAVEFVYDGNERPEEELEHSLELVLNVLLPIDEETEEFIGELRIFVSAPPIEDFF